MTGRQVEVLPGNHLVAVKDGVIVVVAHRDSNPLAPDSRAATAWSALRELIVNVADRRDEKLATALSASVARWAASAGEELEFGVLMPAADGYAVFLHGAVAAVIEHEGQAETLRGSGHSATVANIVRPAVDRAALCVVDDESAPVRLPSSRGVGALTEGVAEGGGAVSWPADAKAIAKPVDKGVPLKAPKVFVTIKPDDAPPPRRAALPVRRQAPVEAAPPSRAQQPAIRHPVRGILCAREHFNDPRVAFCRLCGLRMNQTKLTSVGERPALGFLVLDDGMTFILHDDLVFGRQPEASPSVRQGCTPIRLADPGGQLSRAHAEFRLIDWDVAVVDLGSTNGTYVQPSDQPGWQRLTPHQPYRLPAGSQVLIGRRTVTFDSPHAHI
jgi:hypothetical protein